MTLPMDPYQGAADYAGRIEQELRGMGVCQAEPPPAAAFQSRRAFFGDTMSFYQWLQFVLLARVREIIDTQGAFLTQSAVGTYAVRELDGESKADGLVRMLCEFDRFIERLPHEA